LRVRLSGAPIKAVWDATAGDDTAKAASVAEFLDFYMNGGRLRYLGESSTLSTITDALAAADPESREFLELAMYSAILPEFMVRK
jgi:hypothetical protein